MAETSDPIVAQYRSAANLNARIALHQRFSTNSYGWQRWVFDQLVATPGNRVLELGAGPGTLWRENLARIPDDWAITLTDRSPGMVAAAERDLGDSGKQIQFVVADATALPFADASYDIVIANHMLYHVSEREAAFAEIHRVLRPGGSFFAATNGTAHMRELGDLLERFNPQAHDLSRFNAVIEPFSLENGGTQLAAWFAPITLRIYADSLMVTEVEPLIAYVLSLIPAQEAAFTAAQIAALRAFLEGEIAAKGAISITKATGMFVAQKAVE